MLGDTDFDLLDEILTGSSAPVSFDSSLEYVESLNSVKPLAVTTSMALLGRDAIAIANANDLDESRFFRALPSSSPTDFRQSSDRRQFHPEGDFAPLGVSRKSASDWTAPSQKEFEEQERRLRELERPFRRKLPVSYSVPSSVQFRSPRWVDICAKRKIRRQVMAAMNLFGIRGFARPRYKWYSKVIC